MSSTSNNKVSSTFHTWLYIILFFGGVIASALATKLIIDRTLDNTIKQNQGFGELTGTVQLFLYIFITANIIHLTLIYLDLYRMEHYPEKYLINFPNFFNTKLELALRLFALALLILAVGGKIIPLLDATSSQPSSDNKMWGFVLGNILLFLTLFVWDLFAIYFHPTKSLKSCSRPGVYLLSDSIALSCWCFIFSSVIDNRISTSLAVLLLTISFLYFILMIVRIGFLIGGSKAPDPALPPNINQKGEPNEG